MNKELQRIAIAEACGWTEINFPMGRDTVICPKRERENGGKWSTAIPDFCDDLNAMHEAEKMLSSIFDYGKGESQWSDYLGWLGYCREDNIKEVFGVCHSTAAQRAEAFLKTLGLWQEDPRP